MTNEQIMLDKEWIDGGGIFKAERPARHDVVVKKARQYYSSEQVSKGILGFWTNKRQFVDRKEAAKIAFEAGQYRVYITMIKGLDDCGISEDLW